MEGKRILLFAGTTEGRRLAEYLAGLRVRTHVCAATEYGEGLLPEGKDLTLSHERLSEAEMEKLFEEFAPDFVIDATHPYASEVTANIKKACEKTDTEYLRVVREEYSGAKDCIFVNTLHEAVDFLKTTKGNILAATGSKELDVYTQIEDYRERVYARVLSVAAVVEKCEALGFAGRNLICMQGPFSVELNAAMLRQYNISYLVTKESGKAGGFPEKYEAAARAGAALVVVGRPEKETGYTLEEMYHLLAGWLGDSSGNFAGNPGKETESPDRQVAIVGIGTGSGLDMTLQARKICREAELIIGARRMVEAAALPGQEVFVSYKPEEIVSYIDSHREYEKIAVVFSGDIGFYSGAKQLYETLARERERGMHLDITMVPGISSIVYFCAKLGVAWEDAKLLSLHGKRENLIAAVRGSKRVLALTGNAESIREIGRTLTEYGYGELHIALGEDLSYSSEKITQGTADGLCRYEGRGLAVLCVENPEGGKKPVSGGIPDSGFLRGSVPMTKEEVRSISLSKLRLHKDSVVYDVGAGTGSVSVEAALFAEKGQVYAVERKAEAAELIRKNQRKFGAENLTVIIGSAPEALRGLPAPDRVFIGGSGGKLREILQTVLEKPEERGQEGTKRTTRFVVNAISLETVAETISLLGGLKDSGEFLVEEEDIVHLSVAKAETIGKHHMMMGRNPIYILAFTVTEERKNRRERDGK